MINNVKIEIWGRNFSLPIEYETFDDLSITAQQIDEVKNFINHLEWVEKAKSLVESYCKENVVGDESNDKKDNIFSYIKPEAIFVKRDDKSVRVALMCKYKYDLEHGLAVVFTSNGKATVGIQDIII